MHALQARYRKLEAEFKKVHDLAIELSHENDEFHNFIDSHVIELVKTAREVQKRTSGVSDNQTRVIVMHEELYQDLSQRLDAVERDLGINEGSDSPVSNANDVLQEILRITESETTGGRARTRLRL